MNRIKCKNKHLYAKMVTAISLGVLIGVSIIPSNQKLVSYAKESNNSTSISKVKIEVSATFTADGDGGYNTDVTLNSGDDSKYDLSDYEILNSESGLDKYSPIVVKAYIYAEDGMYFKSKTSSSITFTGSKCEFISADKKDDDTCLIVNFMVAPKNGYVSKPYNAKWYGAKATWNAGYKAKSYNISLLKGDEVVSVKNTSNLECDFYNEMNALGLNNRYRFKVASVGKSASGSDTDTTYEYSDYYGGVNNNNNAETKGTTANPEWVKDSTGWWYKLTDGSYPINEFYQIGEQIYYFNSVGYMCEGWVDLNDSNIANNIKIPANSKIVLRKDGTDKFYCNPVSGEVVFNRSVTIDNINYTFDESGRLVR